MIVKNLLYKTIPSLNDLLLPNGSILGYKSDAINHQLMLFPFLFSIKSLTFN